MNCDLSPDLGGGKGLLGGSDDKGLQCRRPKFNPSVRKIPWGKEWLPTPVFLPGEFQEQRSLAGYSLWGRRVRHDGATNTFNISICVYMFLIHYDFMY